MDEDGRQTGPPLRISDVSIYTQDVRIRLLVPDKMAFTERRVRQSESGRARSEERKMRRLADKTHISGHLCPTYMQMFVYVSFPVYTPI